MPSKLSSDGFKYDVQNCLFRILAKYAWAASGSWTPESEVLQFDWVDPWMGEGENLELQMLDAMVTRTVDAKFIKNHQN